MWGLVCGHARQRGSWRPLRQSELPGNWVNESPQQLIRSRASSGPALRPWVSGLGGRVIIKGSTAETCEGGGFRQHPPKSAAAQPWQALQLLGHRRTGALRRHPCTWSMRASTAATSSRSFQSLTTGRTRVRLSTRRRRSQPSSCSSPRTRGCEHLALRQAAAEPSRRKLSLGVRTRPGKHDPARSHVPRARPAQSASRAHVSRPSRLPFPRERC